MFARDEDDDIRLYVARQIDDHHKLFEKFAHDSYWLIRLEVARKMKDFELIWETFSQDESEDVCLEVLEKMPELNVSFETDELFEIFGSDPDGRIRAEIARRSNDEGLAIEYFSCDPGPIVIKSLISRMTVSSQIRNLFSKHRSADVRVTAQKRLMDLGDE